MQQQRPCWADLLEPLFHQEILLPVYTTTKEACQKHADAVTRRPWGGA